MAARITVVGGGSTHWTPRVLSDLRQYREPARRRGGPPRHRRLVSACDVPGGEHIATTRGIDLKRHCDDRSRRSAGRRAVRGERLLGGRIREHDPRHRDTGPLRGPPTCR